MVLRPCCGVCHEDSIRSAPVLLAHCSHDPRGSPSGRVRRKHHLYGKLLSSHAEVRTNASKMIVDLFLVHWETLFAMNKCFSAKLSQMHFGHGSRCGCCIIRGKVPVRIVSLTPKWDEIFHALRPSTTSTVGK
jgi:hypothetical protein